MPGPLIIRPSWKLFCSLYFCNRGSRDVAAATALSKPVLERVCSREGVGEPAPKKAGNLPVLLRRGERPSEGTGKTGLLASLDSRSSTRNVLISSLLIHHKPDSLRSLQTVCCSPEDLKSKPEISPSEHFSALGSEVSPSIAFCTPIQL